MRETIPEPSAHLLQPDVLLPSQYLAGARKRSAQGPALRLLAAILQDAVECFQKHLFARTRKHQALFHDAEEWICSSDELWPFSFENICQALSIDPSHLRQGLLAWKEQELARRQFDSDLNAKLNSPVPPSAFKASDRRG